jgi:hypothetical protein
VSEPSRRTALLGLLAELRGAGATFMAAPAFVGSQEPRRHILKVAVDRPPAAALPFARAASAIGVPAVFLLPHGRVRLDGGDRGAPKDAGDLRALLEHGHEIGLHVDPARLPDDKVAALGAALAPFAAAGLAVEVAALHHDERHPFDMAALDQLGELGRVRSETGLRWWVDAASHGDGRTVTAEFGVAEAGGSLRAESLDPPFPIHTTPPGVIDALSVNALVDSVARGVCVHELRLSSLV